MLLWELHVPVNNTLTFYSELEFRLSFAHHIAGADEVNSSVPPIYSLKENGVTFGVDMAVMKSTIWSRQNMSLSKGFF